MPKTNSMFYIHDSVILKQNKIQNFELLRFMRQHVVGVPESVQMYFWEDERCSHQMFFPSLEVLAISLQ